MWDDLFGLANPVMTRDQAMTIPGVARARGILLSLIADKPLIDYAGDGRADPQPRWLYHTNGIHGPWRRMANTLDDLIFYPWSLWGVQRGVATSGVKPILDAWHIHYDAWEIDSLDRICVLNEDGQFVPADEEQVILIPGPSEGLLAYATRTLTGTVELEKTWIKRAQNPIPAIELHQTVESNLDPEEAREVVDAWAKARNDPNGAIAFTPYDIEAKALGQLSPDMFIEARNAARLDLAAFFQLPGSLLDATTATASLTYVTQDSQQNAVDALSVPYWARPIEDRLSQDDVLPLGHIVRFGWQSAYTEPPGPIRTGVAGPSPVVDAAAVETTLEVPA